MKQILVELKNMRRPPVGRLETLDQEYKPRGYEDACLSNNDIRSLTASEMRDYLHCPMLVFLKIVKGTKPRIMEPNIFMTLGSFEHEIREKLIKKLRRIYVDFEKINQIDVIRIQQILKQVVEEVKLKFLQDYPNFEITLEDYEIDLITRLWIEEKQRIYQAIKLLEKDIEGFELIENLFPMKLEHRIEARKIGLKGRIDQVFRNNGTLIPLDIKTTFVNPCDGIDEKTMLQLGVYSILLEYETKKDVNLAEVYFSKLLKIKTIPVTRALRIRILKIRDAIFELIKSQKEPEFHFEESKCKFCQFRDYCLQKNSKKGGEKNA